MQVPNRLRFDERHVGSLRGRNSIPPVVPGSGRGVLHSLCTSVEFKSPSEIKEPPQSPLVLRRRRGLELIRAEINQSFLEALGQEAIKLAHRFTTQKRWLEKVFEHKL